MKKLKQNELKEYRLNKLKKCNICPIFKIPLDENNSVVDHIHGNHKTLYPDTNKLIRGVIHRDANTLLGKIENQWIRTQREIKESLKLSDVLRNIAEYIEKYEKLENFDEFLIHPSEKLENEYISKSEYNKLKNEYKKLYPNKKFPNYPKSKKWTKELKIIKKNLKIIN